MNIFWRWAHASCNGQSEPSQPSRHITTKNYWVRGCYVIYSRPTKKKKIEISQTQQKFKQYNTTSKIQSPTLKEDTTYCCASSYWLVVLVLLAHALLFSLRPFQEKRKRKTRGHCHVSLQTSVGRSFPTRPPPSLLNKLPVIVRGSAPITQPGHLTAWLVPHAAFTFLKFLSLICFYDSVTKKPPALNGLFVQKATPGVKKTAHNKDVDAVRTARKRVKLFKKFFELRQNPAEHFYQKLERCVRSPA